METLDQEETGDNAPYRDFRALKEIEEQGGTEDPKERPGNEDLKVPRDCLSSLL